MLRMEIALLLVLAFDAATIYTVNHLDTVPRLLNDILHRFFIGTMVLVVYLFYQYIAILVEDEMYNQNCYKDQKHVHELTGSTRVFNEGDECHNHRFCTVTGEAIYTSQELTFSALPYIIGSGNKLQLHKIDNKGSLCDRLRGSS